MLSVCVCVYLRGRRFRADYEEAGEGECCKRLVQFNYNTYVCVLM